MKYIDSHDETYQGYDITVFKEADYTYTVDVKTLDGEILAGWYDMPDFEAAMINAKLYIKGLNHARKNEL